MGEVQIERRSDAGELCRSILADLPEWFGLADANAGYVRAAEEHPTLVATVDGTEVGIVTVVQHAPRAGEVHLLAVRPTHHGQGVGTALLERAERVLRGAGVRFLQVKTLGPADPDEGYARTRAFYEARGFVTLEDFPDLWGSENPARQMIKTIFPAGLASVPDPGLPWDLGGCTLRRWRDDDWPTIAAASEDDAIQRFTMLPHGMTEPQARARTAFAAAGFERGFPNVAVADETDRAVGMVQWMPLQVPGNAEIAYWLLPEVRGRGWMPAAVARMTAWAFEATGIHRMEALVDLDNVASQRTAEKAGFVREGIRRGYEEVPGRDDRSDLWCFARLAAD